MARSIEDLDNDLITCGICHNEMEDARSLICLHTYCLECLREWSKRRKNEVICPVCREPTPLQENGADGLRRNFFVTKLKDKKAISRQLMNKDEKITCTSCDVPDGNEAVARCLECDEFLCQGCHKAHKTVRLTKNHTMLTLLELRSGKSILKPTKEDHCQDHPGQVMWFYCKSCDTPICRDCTVINHPTHSHELIKIDEAIAGQREEIQRLVALCKTKKNRANRGLKKINKKQSDLESTRSAIIDAIDETKERVKQSFIVSVEKQASDLKTNVSDLICAREKAASTHEEELQIQNSRLKTAIDMASCVTSQGSDCDVASAYKQLTTTPYQLEEIMTPTIDLGMNVIFVDESQKMKFVGSIGRIEETTITNWTHNVKEESETTNLKHDVKEESETTNLKHDVKEESKTINLKHDVKEESETINLTHDVKEESETTNLKHDVKEESKTINLKHDVKEESKTINLKHDVKEESKTTHLKQDVKEESKTISKTTSTHDLKESVTNKTNLKKPWKMIRKFGNSSILMLTVRGPKGVAIHQGGNVAMVAVADEGDSKVNVFDLDTGNLEISIDPTQNLNPNVPVHKSFPRDVLVYKGKYIVTDKTDNLAVYNKQGKRIRQIPMTQRDSNPNGLAINSKGHILVGNQTSKSIDIYHYSNGKQIASLNIRFPAEYIAVSNSTDDRIVISSYNFNACLVIDSEGRYIHNLRLPSDVPSAGWYPTGICTIGEGDEENVLVANNAWDNYAVYRFSLNTGKYLGCVTTAVGNPRGIAATADRKLVVAGSKPPCIKVFTES